MFTTIIYSISVLFRAGFKVGEGRGPGPRPPTNRPPPFPHQTLHIITSPALAGAGEVLQLVCLFVCHTMYIMY